MKNAFRTSDGYTLIETLVALTLFASVVIPVISTIGTFMSADAGDKMRRSLTTAEIEIDSVCRNNTLGNEDRVIAHNLILHRTVRRAEGLICVCVQITDRSGRGIVSLEKDFLP